MTNTSLASSHFETHVHRVSQRSYLLVVLLDVAAYAAAATEHFVGEHDLSEECFG